MQDNYKTKAERVAHLRGMAHAYRTVAVMFELSAPERAAQFTQWAAETNEEARVLHNHRRPKVGGSRLPMLSSRKA